jgi:hypothetical protein
MSKSTRFTVVVKDNVRTIDSPVMEMSVEDAVEDEAVMEASTESFSDSEPDAHVSVVDTGNGTEAVVTWDGPSEVFSTLCGCRRTHALLTCALHVRSRGAAADRSREEAQGNCEDVRC